MGLPSYEIPLQDPPVRALPERPLGVTWLCALAVFLSGLLLWEAYWRHEGHDPGYRNSEGLWAIQRRSIDDGRLAATVLLGSSRAYFDLQLPVWEDITGERPIQLALEGTSPLSALENLAADEDFHGRVLVGVSPALFFTGFEYRGKALRHYLDETLSQQIGQWLSMRLLEPWLAFYSDTDLALFTVLRRQPWLARHGVRTYEAVRKLAVHDADRNTRLWQRVEDDPGYQAMAKRIWSQTFSAPPPPMMDTPEKARATMRKQIGRARIAVSTLRARGVPVVFVRLPSTGDFHAFEDRVFPRARTWDELLAETGAPGIHFEDHPQLQGYELPEWSHLSASEADRFTAAIAPMVESAFTQQRGRRGPDPD
ncbi:MAG: hypothetical protein ACR2J7_06105 [Luteimonas sp.]